MTLTLQPTKQSDMLANSNTYKVSKNERHFCDEDKNKQIHQKIKIHLKNISKIEKHKKLNMTKQKTDMNISKTDKDEETQQTSTTKTK